MSQRHQRRGSGGSAQPWLTLLLAAAALGWMAWADAAAREVGERADGQLARAADYLLAHPYLEAPEIVVRQLGDEALETRRQVFQGELRRNGGVGVSPARQREERQQFALLLADHAREQEQLPIARFGLRAGASPLHSWFSHVIAHGSWLTLATNVLVLIVLGSLAERSWQRSGFGALIVGSVISSAGFSALAYAELERPLVGLGGVLAGIVGATATSVLRGRREPGWAVGLLLGIGWLALPAATGVEWSFGPDAIATRSFTALLSPWIHAAGLGFGCLFGLVAPAGERRAERSAVGRVAEPAASLLEQAKQALQDGDRERAFALLSQRLHDHPSDHATGLLLWQVGRAIGRNLDAVAALLRVIREELRKGQHDELVSHWLELGTVDVPIRAEPALLLAIAGQLELRGHRDAALSALASALADRESGSRIAAQVARAARALDPELTQRAAWRALADAELPVAERHAVELLLGELRDAGLLQAADAIETALPGPARATVQRLSGEATWTPPAPASALAQWEDPQLHPEDAAQQALDLHGAVDLDAIQAEVNLDSHPPIEISPAARPEARVARAGLAPRLAPAGTEEIPVPLPMPRGTTPAPLTAPAALGAAPERQVEVLPAVPLELAQDVLRLEIVGVGKKKLRYAQIQALGAGAIQSDDIAPVILIDLVLNWRDGCGEPLKVVRLRSDRFDALRFAANSESPSEAMRQLIDALLERSGAQPLPDPHSVRGLPFKSFSDLAAYQRDVLLGEA